MSERIVPPPIKSQGIKTKLIPWIKEVLPSEKEGLWIEPFMGTCVVAFNVMPKRALLCDTNPHLVGFYNAIAKGDVTAEKVKTFLQSEGQMLLDKGERHYYDVRDRFNDKQSPFDFLFLNRSGFNGMIRFNRRGQLNVPFCRKPNRFAQAYVTKIVNQIERVSLLVKTNDFIFKCQDFEKTLTEAPNDSVIYCDPPYIDRHADYYNGWDEESEQRLFTLLSATSARFILSTWHHNDYRKNEYIEKLWGKFNILTQEHFYHVGGREENRRPMVEALVTNFAASRTKRDKYSNRYQAELFAITND